MLGLGLWSLLARYKQRLYEWRPLHLLALFMGPLGFVATIAGWVTAEAGRQPSTVYGLLRTADSASPLAAPAVGASLLSFIVVYFVVFGAGTAYILSLMSSRRIPARRGRSSGRKGRCAPPASRRHPLSIRPAPSAMRARRRNHDDGDRQLPRPADPVGVHPRLRGLRLCGDGRVRPRHRHPVSVLQPGGSATAP